MQNHLIISASSDIAQETAKILKNNGGNLFITARKQDDLDRLTAEFSCPGFLLDSTDFEATKNAFQAASDHFQGQIDSVSCFSGSVLLKPAHLTTPQEYQQVINDNLNSAFFITSNAAKFMKKQGGAVLLFASAAAMQGIPNHEAIAAAKGGVISLTKSAAATYADCNLRFNAIAPGLTQTKMTAKITQNDAARQASTQMHALKKLANASDVANMAAFLLSDQAQFITGQIIAVDGGLSNLMPKK